MRGVIARPVECQAQTIVLLAVAAALVSVGQDANAARGIAAPHFEVGCFEALRNPAEKMNAEFALIRRGNRLSVFPVSAAQWKLLLSLE